MRQKSAEPYPAWADAHLALKYISKGKARGSKVGLWVRGESQRRLGHVGKWASRGGLVIFVGLVSLALLCVGIQNIRLDTSLSSLWTPDSGRLLQELTYVSRVSGLTTDTNEMLIQKPKKNAHHSILHSKALLEHLEVLQKALKVTVDMYDITWSLKDICYSANIPTFDVQFIDQIFEKIFPCVIITPLDCFWEGSKLLGPDFPIQLPGDFLPLKWTNLNPQELLKRAQSISQSNGAGFPFEILEGFMKRAGIETGYQEKPCLDPFDSECPESAPNKNDPKPPDVGSALSEGCYGFAPRFMHWAPDLIIGGAVRNKSGSLVKAGGLMSTVQLMSSSELFDYYRETWRLHHVDWTELKAQTVLTTWQNRFNTEIAHLTMDYERSQQFDFYSFTPAGLDAVVEDASQFSWIWSAVRVAGVVLAVVLVGTILGGDYTNLKLRTGLLVGGAALALLGVAAGCGVAGFLKIPFNVASVQVLPYLSVSLVSPVFFVLLHSQLNSGCDAKGTLKRHGFSVMLGMIAAAVFIAAGALFPIPAVRSLALQGGVFVTLSALALIVVYPALCEIVIKKNKLINSSVNKSICTAPSTEAFLKTNGTCSGRLVKNNNLNLNKHGNRLADNKFNNLMDNGLKKDNIDIESGTLNNNNNGGKNRLKDRVGKPWTHYYIALINWKWFTCMTVLLYGVWMIGAALGVTRLRLGLPITDVVPSHSAEWEFLTAQGKLFPVYHVKAVTKINFDYPNNQKLMHKFHETMSSLPWIIRDDNGGVTPMWLSVFRSWLSRLQSVFDKEWNLKYLHKEGWTENATADGILAWKLAVQTGHVDHPVDSTQLPRNRLVEGGVINPRAFYVYLSAWAWNDPLAYGSTAANLKPEPRVWVHSPEDKDLKIPKSSPIKYTEISYLLRTSKDFESTGEDQESQVLAFVREIRQICSSFESRGLPVFPWGIPFRFYEQYLNLPMNSGVVIGLATGMTSVILFFSLGFSYRPVGVVIIAGFITMAQIAGTVGWLGVGLNALPVEIALVGVSLIIFGTIQLVVAFSCVPGSIKTRRSLAFNLVGPPCVQSLILVTSTALILYSPDFTFIFTHFTLLVAVSALFCLVNFLLLVPVLLIILKPQCWLMGFSEDPSILQPLTPSPVLKRGSSGRSKSHQKSSSGRSSSGRSSSRNNYAPPPYNFRGSSSRNYYKGGGPASRAPSENSLSTITEEPSSCATTRRYGLNKLNFYCIGNAIALDQMNLE